MQKKSLREIALEKAKQQASQLPQDQIDHIQQQAQQLSGKSEAELVREIARLKKTDQVWDMIRDNRIEQIADQLRPILDAEQQKKLTGILEFLKK